VGLVQYICEFNNSSITKLHYSIESFFSLKAGAASNLLCVLYDIILQMIVSSVSYVSFVAGMCLDHAIVRAGCTAQLDQLACGKYE
jgi:hypothetical protein